VLATGPNSWVGSGSGSTRNQTVATGLTTRKTRTIRNGPVLPPKSRHFKFTSLAPIKYLSSDRIMTWSVLTLCSFSGSFTSHSQVCDRTNIHWMVIENPLISAKMWCYFTANPQILVQLQIWKREVEERIILHNLHINHVMIWWDLRYLTGANVAGTVKLNCSTCTIQPKNCMLISVVGKNPAKTKRVGFLAGSGTE